ncbi:MAG: hypothetical protein IJR27_00890, partial [Synergistaceae bacterium]|nr:hypothetical protein [Synergistaceae bacterium]
MGKKLSEEVFDTEENPDSSYGGLYRLVFVYNSYGLRSEEIYYNINPELSMKKLIQYDSNGKKTKQEWVKTDSSQQ